MILELITYVLLANAVRSTPLVPNLELSERAQVRAEYLCTQGQWSHENWRASFTENERFIGENLAKGNNTPQEIQDAWMNSPTHEANIMNPSYAEMGIGKACDITVQLFRG